MSDGDSNGRLSISEERVKNLLYEFKDDLLRDIQALLDKKADLVMLTDARKDLMRHDERIQRLEDWKIAEQASDSVLKDLSAKRLAVWAIALATISTLLGALVSSGLWIAFGT